MQASVEGLLQHLVHKAVTADAALAGEGLGHDINVEVSFTALPPSLMAVMLL